MYNVYVCLLILSLLVFIVKIHNSQCVRHILNITSNAKNKCVCVIAGNSKENFEN